MGYGAFHKWHPWIYLLLLAAFPAAAQAQQVRITGLTDVGFGVITNFASDLTVARNVCVFSSAAGRRYAITATGSGTGGAFTLAAGSARLAYEVQWAGSRNQTSGTSLTAGVLRGGFSANTSSQTCATNPPATASLITILRNSAVSTASAGNYSGTLTLIVTPN
jgi:hypothetical protein